MSFQTNTNICEISSFSRKFILFSRKFVVIREICFYTHTHTQIFAKYRLFREISSFSQTHILFSRKFVVIREDVFSNKHKHSQNIVFFAKFILFLRNLSLQTQTNIREISSFSQKFILFSRKFVVICVICLYTLTHKQSRNIVSFAKIYFYFCENSC